MRQRVNTYNRKNPVDPPVADTQSNETEEEGCNWYAERDH